MGGLDNNYVPEKWPPDACVSVITEHPDASSDLAGTGAYCQGPAIAASSDVNNSIQDSAGCGTVLWGIARDFLDHSQAACGAPVGAAHPDFGAYCCGNPLGTVLPDLGTDGKPVYNPANVTGDYPGGGVGLTGKSWFDQWYRDAPGVNLPYLVAFDLIPTGDGKTSIFSSRMYFPVDGVGFDVGSCIDYNYGHDNKRHNFRFTTELHTKFKYLGGEVFSFFGDDDVWVFVNKKLALDLAGVHSRMEGTIKLDTKANDLGLVIGQVYGMDLFQAERFGSESNFEITTSMTFVDCGINPTTIIN
jgi:fibro-slime domain-containing protein